MWGIDSRGYAKTYDHCGRMVVVKPIDTPYGQKWRIVVQVATNKFPLPYPTQDEAMAVVERWLSRSNQEAK